MKMIRVVDIILRTGGYCQRGICDGCIFELRCKPYIHAIMGSYFMKKFRMKLADTYILRTYCDEILADK